MTPPNIAPPIRSITDSSSALLKELEGLPGTHGAPVLRVEDDGAGNPTYGWGTKDATKKIGESVTMQECIEAFSNRVGYACANVDRLVNVDLNDNQFSALVLFFYNVGIEHFATSTLLKKLNAGDYKGVPEQLNRWIKENDPRTGKEVVSEGLQARRKTEGGLWLTPADSSSPIQPIAPQEHAETARTPIAPPQSILTHPTTQKLIGSVGVGTLAGAVQLAQSVKPAVETAAGIWSKFSHLPHWVGAGLIAGTVILAGWGINDIKKDV